MQQHYASEKNAAGLEYVKSKASHPMGTLMSTLTALKNIPFTNNIDIHEALWLYDEGVAETNKALGMMKECLKYSRINKERAYKMARENFCAVTGLADMLVKECNISFEQAHYIVGTMVGEVIQNGKGTDGMTSGLLDKTAEEYLGKALGVSDKMIPLALEPYCNVQSKVTFGGPQQESVENMILKAEKCSAGERIWLDEKRQFISEGYMQLGLEEEKIMQ